MQKMQRVEVVVFVFQDCCTARSMTPSADDKDAVCYHDWKEGMGRQRNLEILQED